MDDKLEQYRYFLKDSVRLTIDFSKTDQHRGIPPPPVEKPVAPDGRLIDLPGSDRWQGTDSLDLTTAIRRRESRRDFIDQPLNLEEISFLLWATQGIRKRLGHGTALRTVPSAGGRHSFETYLCALNVTGLKQGVYRYLPLEGQLLFEFSEDQLEEKIIDAALGQTFVGKGGVVFVWTAIPYRMEWRYGLAAHKVILIDAGHLCQNLYLACEEISAGTCAVAAYHQEKMDRLLKLDGEDEFTVYLAPVGKVRGSY